MYVYHGYESGYTVHQSCLGTHENKNISNSIIEKVEALDSKMFTSSGF